MDLSIDVKDYRLNIRCGGIIVHNNKVLAHRNINKAHYCLPGGRIQIGENSEETIKREIEEELGKKIEIKEFVATIENFFIMENKKYHEIYFLYRVEFINEEDKKIDYILHNMEGKECLQYEWLDIEKINEYNLLPQCSKELLKSKNYPLHIINNELSK